MSSEIADEDDDDFSTDDSAPEIETSLPNVNELHSDARRRIEELMERRRLKDLLEDPYRDIFDEDL